MYIPLKPVLEKYGIVPKGVIQVGCHWAEEHEEFVSCGIERFVYIEPCKEAFDVMINRLIKLKESILFELKGGNYVHFLSDDNKYEVNLFNMACGSEEGEMPMYVSHQNQGQSNSFRKPVLHLTEHPDVVFDDTEIVKVVTLDSLPIEKEKYNILVTDCEGYDSEVMRGGRETLKHINLIYSEVNRGETREGNMLIDEFEKLLWDEGFVMVETFWPSPTLSWGDAVFVKRELIKSE